MSLDIRFLALIIIVQAVAMSAVAFNMGIFRQVFIFCYLLLVPGIVLIRLLKIDNLDLSETLVFSVGLSVTILYLVGLLLNELLPLVGFQGPLSSFSSLVSINVIVLIISLLGVSGRSPSQEFLRSLFAVHNLVAVVLPVLSIAGSFLAVYYHNSALLLAMIALMAVCTLLAAYRKVFSHESYPIILLASTFAIVFMTFYATRFALIWDQAFEFYSFRITQINHYWNPNYLPSIGLQLWKTHSMLSVNMLPTILSETSGLNGASVFAILYPFVLSFIPVVVYKLYRTQANKEVSFIAAAFFIANCVGLGWGNDMQKIAQLFYVLLLLIMFRDGLSDLARNVLFGLFTFSLIVSHYSMAYIFAFTLLLAWIFFAVRKESSPKISITHVVFVLVSTFCWFLYVSGGATFEAILESARFVIDSLSSNFFNLNARGSKVTQFFGISEYGTNTIFNEISRFVFQVSALLIILGFLGMLLRRNKTRFAKEFQAMILLNLLIVILNVVLPGLSATFLMQRYYQTTLIVLSPLFVIGGYFVFDILGKIFRKAQFEKLARFFLLSVLILLLLFQSGFVYELTRVRSYSVALSGYRIDKVTLYDGLGYSNAFDVYGAMWLGSKIGDQQQAIYCDNNAKDGALLSYGLINYTLMKPLLNTTYTYPAGSYIFLRWVNVMESEVVLSSLVWNTSDIANTLNEQNVVYSNGASIVYEVP